jgi:hypothetical protein
LKTIARHSHSLPKRYSIALCIGFALLTAIFPFTRSFFRAELNYNEGWNIYNAATVAAHQQLYPVRYGWTTVNYPMLSFVLMAQLHRLTHDYLFTARIVSLLSLIGCCILVGLIVRKLSGSAQAAWLAGFFCLAIFCTAAHIYIGVDDPQMLALFFFLAGLALYIGRKQSLLAIAAAAALFVIGGCIKHNPIDFPLAVLMDLAILSRRRALWFSAWGLALTAIAVALNIHYGGPYFISQVMAPRSYSWIKALIQMVDVLGPLVLPFSVAVGMAFTVFRDDTRRIAAILLATSFVLGSYFGGGQGVSINSQFSTLLAITILIGLFFAELAAGRWRGHHTMASLSTAPLLLFGWLIIPMLVNGISNPLRSLRETAIAQRHFDREVALLRSENGPVLCESLLRCYFAGKPYVYDPFNATRLIEFGKLNPAVPINTISSRQDTAIELEEPIQNEFSSDRFNAPILQTIQQNYIPILDDEDAVIYVPRSQPAYVQNTHVKPVTTQSALRHHHLPNRPNSHAVHG